MRITSLDSEYCRLLFPDFFIYNKKEETVQFRVKLKRSIEINKELKQMYFLKDE